MPNNETNGRHLRFTQFTIDHAKIAVFWCTSDGYFLYVNDTACRWLQYSREELLKMHVADINPEFPMEGWPAHWQEIKEKGIVRIESVHQRKDGKIYPVEIYSNYVQYEGEEYKFATVHDITERRAAEDQLAKVLCRLEKQNAELERFAYTVSHDLKTPLITIQGYAGLLNEDLDHADLGEAREHLEVIGGAAERMERSLSDLLHLARIGRVAELSRNVSMQELVKEAVVNLRPRIEDKSAEIRIEDNLPMVWGDEHRLLEVWTNLIENALKFSQEKPFIEIGSITSGDTVTFFVRDNGDGMRAEYRERVFGIFEQLTPHGDGAGVGLTIARRIVEVHNGKIWLESAGPGNGCTVYFTIGARQPVETTL